MKTVIKSILAAMAILFSTFTAQAQVKIGSNPMVIGANSNLEVEAADAHKVIVHKADGTVVIENTPSGSLNDSLLTVDNVGNVRRVSRASQYSVQLLATPIVDVLVDGDSDGILNGLTTSSFAVNTPLIANVTPFSGPGILGKDYELDFTNLVPSNAKGVTLSFLLDHGSGPWGTVTTEFRNKGVAMVRGYAAANGMSTDVNSVTLPLPADKKITFVLRTQGTYFFLSISILGYTL